MEDSLKTINVTYIANGSTNEICLEISKRIAEAFTADGSSSPIRELLEKRVSDVLSGICALQEAQFGGIVDISLK